MKEDKIQEAYGDNWDFVKDYVWVHSGCYDITRHNRFASKEEKRKINSIFHLENMVKVGQCIIPKSLQLIEEPTPRIEKQLEYFLLGLHDLVNSWQQQQIQYETLAETHKENEHNFKKFKYKAIATRDCWKQLLKQIK
jgi:hypothetical protein